MTVSVAEAARGRTLPCASVQKAAAHAAAASWAALKRDS